MTLTKIAQQTWRMIFAAAALSGAAACVSAADETRDTGKLPLTKRSVATLAQATPQQLLRPYYARLREQTEFPTFEGVSLDASQSITRFAFGSCNHHGRAQLHWGTIAGTNPQLMMMIGDNVYADTGYRGGAGLGSFLSAYRQQAAHPEFQSFAKSVPILATWDDHDYGPNDSGGSFFAKEFSETIFEEFWNASEEVRDRPGIYQSVTVGKEGSRVQFILLDTRYFRDEMNEKPYRAERYPLGYYLPHTDPAMDILGPKQMAWLQSELAEPADLRVVVSSIQVITNAHDYEAWENFPHARDRLWEALGARAGGGLVLLSGDRHSGGIYTATPDPLGGQVWELTSSSLNMAFPRDDASEREPDPNRVTEFISEENFGLVDIDWSNRQVTLRLMKTDGGEHVAQTVGF